jgi:hypothetical protein
MQCLKKTFEFEYFEFKMVTQIDKIDFFGRTNRFLPFHKTVFIFDSFFQASNAKMLSTSQNGRDIQVGVSCKIFM